MKNKEIEEKIYQEFENRKPDLFQKIIEQCPNMTQVESKESFFTKMKKELTTKRFSYSLATIGFAFIFLFMFILQGQNPTPQAYSIIAIDVNPSIVLELDDEDKVINLILNNEDAKTIIGDMDLIGVDYSVAINAIIGSMVTNGYISTITNSILLSISSDDDTRQTTFMEELSETINTLLNNENIISSVIVQNLHFEEADEELAERLNISEAKAELILDIIEVDPRMTVEALALLSINDLNLLLESKNIVLENISKKGTASTIGYLTIENAYQIALTELGINESDVLEYEIELDQEDGVMVYVVEIETATNDYEILVHAKEGIIFEETDEDDNSFPTDVLTESNLIQIIVTELNLNPNDIIEFEYSKEMENGVAFFDVSFEYNEDEYELEVDAMTGEIYSNSMDDDGFGHQNEDDESESEEEIDEEDTESDN